MKLFELKGSGHPELAAFIKRGIVRAPAHEKPIDALFVLNPGKELPEINESRPLRTISREEYRRVYSTSERDRALVRKFADQHGLEVRKDDPARHVMEIRGTARQFSKALDTKLVYAKGRSGAVLVHVESLKVPKNLHGVVLWVFGLDQIDLVEHGGSASDLPKGKRENPFLLSGGAGTAFTVPRLAELYQFPEMPAAERGRGQCVGAIQLDGGYRPEDIEAYFKKLHLRPPEIRTVGPRPGIKLSPDPISNYQVTQGIQIVGALVPRALQVIYYRNDTQGTLGQYYRAFLDAIYDDVNRPSVLTNSWGFPENVPGLGAFAPQIFVFESLFQRAAHLGITIVSAAGSSGSLYGYATASGDYQQDTSIVATGLPVANYPASSAYHLACGGTNLVADPRSGGIEREVVWNGLSHLMSVNGYPSNAGATGGGVSRVLPRPRYQRRANVPTAESCSWTNGKFTEDDPFVGRGVPDVAADADIRTGYRLYFDGEWGMGGGTGVTAPLWAGLIALINQRLGGPVGFVNPALYHVQLRERRKALRTITEGTNGAFNAGADRLWNPCCGLGSPRGKRLLAALARWYRGPSPAKGSPRAAAKPKRSTRPKR